MLSHYYMCVRACVRVCVRACVCACVRACVRSICVLSQNNAMVFVIVNMVSFIAHIY